MAKIKEVFLCFISSCVPSTLVAERHPITPLGAPAASAVSAKILLVSLIHLFAEGWGLKTIELRLLSAINALFIVVEVGLVEGITAAITPTGAAISRIPFSKSSRMIPTVLRSLIASKTNSEANLFLRILSSRFPNPVSSTAALASFSAASKLAAAICLTIVSICS